MCKICKSSADRALHVWLLQSFPCSYSAAAVNIWIFTFDPIIRGMSTENRFALGVVNDNTNELLSPELVIVVILHSYCMYSAV